MDVPSIVWPHGKRFAFSVFDDTDQMTLGNGPIVYDFLAGLGFRTTKSVWPLAAVSPCLQGGTDCEDAGYVRWAKELQAGGFEIALHGVCDGTATRDEWQRGLEKFKDLFGHYPRAHANHAGCLDSIYWGEQRVSGVRRLGYNVLTRYQGRRFHGERPESPGFWGDYCRERIDYVRNFTYADINTLKACPEMPYHDPERPFVKAWFASSEGPLVDSFVGTLSDHNQDRLEAEGGACIMYTHFAKGFTENGSVHPGFARQMQRLAQRPGWFVPVSQLLDYIQQARGGAHVITPGERRRLEGRWLAHKIRVRGT